MKYSCRQMLLLAIALLVAKSIGIGALFNAAVKKPISDEGAVVILFSILLVIVLLWIKRLVTEILRKE